MFNDLDKLEDYSEEEISDSQLKDEEERDAEADGQLIEVEDFEDDEPVRAIIMLNNLDKPDYLARSNKTRLTQQRLDHGEKPDYFNQPRSLEIVNKLKSTWDCITLTLNQVPAIPYIDPREQGKSIADERRNFGKAMEENLDIDIKDERLKVLSAFKYLTKDSSELAIRFAKYLSEKDNLVTYTDQDKRLQQACLDAIRLNWLRKCRKEIVTTIKQSIEWTCEELENPDGKPSIPTLLKDNLKKLKSEFKADLERLKKNGGKPDEELLKKYDDRTNALFELDAEYEKKTSKTDFYVFCDNKYKQYKKKQENYEALKDTPEINLEIIEQLLNGEKKIENEHALKLFLRLHYPEWLHSIANSLGGNIAVWNGAAGSFAANTEMAVIENTIAGKRGIGVEVKTYVDPDTRVAQWYEYTVNAYDHNDNLIDSKMFEIDATRDWFNDQNFEATQAEIKEFLKKTWEKRSAITSIPSFQLPEIKEVKLVNGKQNSLLPKYLNPGPVFLTEKPDTEQPYSNFEDSEFLNEEKEWKRGYERYQGYKERMLKKYPFHKKSIQNAIKEDNTNNLNQLLTQENFDIANYDVFGNNIAHYSAYYGSVNILKALQRENRDLLHKKNINGDSPLNIAAQEEKFEAVQFLIESCKLDINAKNGAGDTILHQAMRDGNFEIIGYLLLTNTNLIFMKNEAGLTPFQVAIQNGHVKVLENLVDNSQIELDQKEITNTIDKLKIFIEFESIDKNPLQLAIKYNRQDMLKYVLALVDDDTRLHQEILFENYEDKTQAPLCCAAKFDRTECAEIILKELEKLLKNGHLEPKEFIEHIIEAKKIAQNFGQIKTENYLHQQLPRLRDELSEFFLDTEIANIFKEELHTPSRHFKSNNTGKNPDVPQSKPKAKKMAIDSNIIKALGDGNCAFNALALALLDLVAAGYIKHNEVGNMQMFLKSVANKQGIDISEGYQILLDFFRNISIEHRQKILGPMLRGMAVSWFKMNKENYLNELGECAKPDVRNYLLNFICKINKYESGNLLQELPKTINNYPGLKDFCDSVQVALIPKLLDYIKSEEDIDIDIDKISLLEIVQAVINKYGFDGVDLVQKIMDETLAYYKKEFSEWWEKNGYDCFIKQMEVNATYAGDIELTALADIFDLDIYDNLRLISGEERKGAYFIRLKYNGRDHWDYMKPIEIDSIHLSKANEFGMQEVKKNKDDENKENKALEKKRKIAEDKPEEEEIELVRKNKVRNLGVNLIRPMLVLEEYKTMFKYKIKAMAEIIGVISKLRDKEGLVDVCQEYYSSLSKLINEANFILLNNVEPSINDGKILESAEHCLDVLFEIYKRLCELKELPQKIEDLLLNIAKTESEGDSFDFVDKDYSNLARLIDKYDELSKQPELASKISENNLQIISEAKEKLVKFAKKQQMETEENDLESDSMNLEQPENFDGTPNYRRS